MFEADFIAGPADNHTFSLTECHPEWMFPVPPEPNYLFKESDTVMDAQIKFRKAVYKYIGHGAYLFYGIED